MSDGPESEMEMTSWTTLSAQVQAMLDATIPTMPLPANVTDDDKRLCVALGVRGDERRALLEHLSELRTAATARDAVVEAAVRWEDAVDRYIRMRGSNRDDARAVMQAMTDANDALRAAVAAYRAATTPTARPGAED